MGYWSGEVIYIGGDILKIFFYKQVKKSRTQVITAQGAKCQNIGIVELNVRIREFETPWLFHVLEDLEFPCILGVDFIRGSKIILDFDRKSLAIPDSQIDKVVKTIEEEKVEIDLSKTKLEEKQKQEFRDLINSFRDYFHINRGLHMFYIMRLTREISHQLFLVRIDDLIMNILHTAIMSALDLRSGYYQLAVNPSDIAKTTLVTKNGIYVFRCMPFGLSGSDPNFQKAIDIILKPAQKAFHVVKAAITKAPILKFPDFKKPFELFTDASSIGVGAVLNLEHRPVVFASRMLSGAERNYTLTKRECLAVVWALNKFRTYLGSL
ncbi:retrovirus-related Pol polyprotein from transposon gypsy [Trichonephila clavipes]|nr:retrovirus-related Pol polyprotein from transposon gypsy [Trichonephila clavipes]